MKKVIVFGTNQLAELANYYITNDSEDKVACFTVNRDFFEINTFCDKPVVVFEELIDNYSPNDYLLFAPMTGIENNKVRERIYNEGKRLGYSFYSYKSSKATILTKEIGDNCFILEDNTIQPFVKIGNNCVLWSGNHIGHHSVVNDHVFITSHCVISGNCNIKSYSWLGVNCTLRDGLTIEEGTTIGMGSCVTKSTEPYKVYIGVPAKAK